MTVTTIQLENDAVSPARIPDVLVRVFDLTGDFVTSATTNSSGEAVFDLPDDDYDLYFFKRNVSLLNSQPQRITVDSGDPDTPPNTFLVLAHETVMPESTDPLRCRISGTVLGGNGLPTKELQLTFGMCPEVAVLGGNVIAPQPTINARSDDEGYFEFDLLRGMRYRGFFPQLEKLFDREPPEVRCIIPDLPALALQDLLFPVPVDAAFSVATLSLTAGALPPDESVEATITYSDGSVNQDGIRPTPPWFTSISAVSSNDAVVTVEFQVDKLVITPVAAGTADITIVRTISPTYITYDPTPAFVTDVLTVTVA
jgi:hypothetical protein